MKTRFVEIDITFSEDIPITYEFDKQLIENIRRAIQGEIDNGLGIAPEVPDFSGYTESFTVSTIL